MPLIDGCEATHQTSQRDVQWSYERRLRRAGRTTLRRLWASQMTASLTTFPQRGEFDKARHSLQDLGLGYEVISPDPGYAQVGTSSLAVDTETRLRFASHGDDFLCSGWVDYRPANINVPSEPPPEFSEDMFGKAAVMVLAPCVADQTKIRLVAHIGGDLTAVLPYLNSEMRGASYNRNGPTLTFMDGYRMVSLYPRRITVAKADELVDGWRTLETIRCRSNTVWARRAEIQPCYEMRKRPPVLEIFRRLPRTNCGLCGEPTCMAFAAQVWQGQRPVRDCRPVFEGDQNYLKDALVEICLGLATD